MRSNDPRKASDMCDTSPRPEAFKARIELWLQGFRCCYVTPSYSGGASDAAVDGGLRRPQCFGSRREPWAQTGERAHCVVELDDLPEVIETRMGASWIMRPATA